MNWLERWIFGWIQIVGGIVKVLTLGLVTFDFCYYYLRWLSHRHYDYNNC